MTINTFRAERELGWLCHHAGSARTEVRHCISELAEHSFDTSIEADVRAAIREIEATARSLSLALEDIRARRDGQDTEPEKEAA